MTLIFAKTLPPFPWWIRDAFFFNRNPQMKFLLSGTMPSHTKRSWKNFHTPSPPSWRFFEKNRRLRRRRPPRPLGGRPRFVWFLCFLSVLIFYFIFFLTSGCFRDPRRSSMRIYFWTLAHECSGLSLHSSDMFHISSWRSWRLQARCTIPFFLSFCLCLRLRFQTASSWIKILVPLSPLFPHKWKFQLFN